MMLARQICEPSLLQEYQLILKARPMDSIKEHSNQSRGRAVYRSERSPEIGT